MISVIVAICFVVFMGLGDTSLVYYAAMPSSCWDGKNPPIAAFCCADNGMAREAYLSRCSAMSTTTPDVTPSVSHEPSSSLIASGVHLGSATGRSPDPVAQ